MEKFGQLLKQGKCSRRHRLFCHALIQKPFRYTFGKPVKGEATVSVDISDNIMTYSSRISSLQTNKQKTFSIDGKGFVEFDLKKDLLILQEYDHPIVLNVDVIEHLTGNQLYY